MQLLYQYQAVEREQERDEYHAKILQLESTIKDRDRKDGVTQRLTTEVCYILLGFLLPLSFLMHYVCVCVDVMFVLFYFCNVLFFCVLICFCVFKCCFHMLIGMGMSSKEVMFLPQFVCLLVCLSQKVT